MADELLESIVSRLVVIVDHDNHHLRLLSTLVRELDDSRLDGLAVLRSFRTSDDPLEGILHGHVHGTSELLALSWKINSIIT